MVKARQVDELASEVASASRQQTQGITQINAAVGQMDKVTQSNASSAEESAAAAEELNSQAALMKKAVNELTQFVGGSHHGAGVATDAAANVSNGQPGSADSLLKSPARKPFNGNGHPVVRQKDALASRRLEFPLDGDFKDF